MRCKLAVKQGKSQPGTGQGTTLASSKASTFFLYFAVYPVGLRLRFSGLAVAGVCILLRTDVVRLDTFFDVVLVLAATDVVLASMST